MKKIRIDPDKCTGCRTCEIICSFTHDQGKINPEHSRIRIFKDHEEGVFLPVIVGSSHRVEYLKKPVLNVGNKECDPYAVWSLFKPSDLECNFCTNCVKWCMTNALSLIK